MIKKQASKHLASSQYQEFVKAARDLGCDDDESHFEEKLKKVARHKPTSRPIEEKDKLQERKQE